MRQDDRYVQAKKVTLLGALLNLILGLLKLIGGYLFHSHALMADGVHSFSDLLADILVLFASKYSSLDADENHPYGHQRIETAATLALSLFLIVTGSGIAWDALDELTQGTHTIPNGLALPIACFSILANELSFQYTRSVGKRIQSQLIIANAWHHRSDAAASLVVFLALIGSLMGFGYLDVLAAGIVGILIIKMGWDYAWESVRELVDTAVDPGCLEQIEQAIRSVDGVQKIHQLRSRLMGGDVFIDVHVLVSPQISVSEGHYIAQRVHQQLVDQIELVKDVTVHVDPEDDEISSPCIHLPSRSAIKDLLLDGLLQDFPDILFWNLHYLDGKMNLDLVCSNNFSDWSRLHQQLTQALKKTENIKEIRLLSLQETVLPQEKTC